MTPERIAAVLGPGCKCETSSSHDIYLLPPSEDPETCGTWLRMRANSGRYSLMCGARKGALGFNPTRVAFLLLLPSPPPLGDDPPGTPLPPLFHTDCSSSPPGSRSG